MPALVAKASGLDAENKLITRGAQITYLDPETKTKAELKYPVKYSGSPAAIIMIQKAAEPTDNKWYVTTDIETALALKKADSTIRIACLASTEKFDQNPLEANGNSDIVLCINKNTPPEFVHTAGDIFTNKQFNVYVTKPEQTQTFPELLKTQGTKAVCQKLKSAQKIATATIDPEIIAVLKALVILDKNIQTSATKTMAKEALKKYAGEVTKNRSLFQKLQHSVPSVAQRFTTIIQALEQDIVEL